MRENSATGKVILALFFVTFVLLLVCLGIYFLVAPNLNAVATATLAGRTQAAIDATRTSQAQTQDAVVFQMSQHAAETLTAAPTSTFLPTAVPSQTRTPTLTPTVTLTPTPVLSKCTIQTSGLIYPLPSKAFSQFSVTTKTPVNVLAQADRTGWYLVNYEKSKIGWMNVENLKFSSSCIPVSTQMEFLAGWDKDGVRVFMDDFYTDFGWMTNERDISAVTKDKRTYVLPLSGNTAQQAYLKNQLFDVSEKFALHTSYSLVRENKYFGVRFWDDGSDYYELRATVNCELELYDGDNLLSRRPALTKQNCYAGFQNYLAFEVFENSNGQLTLSAALNESPSIDFLLPSQYVGKQFSWVWGLGSQVEVEYLLLLK
jgi:hypothetical protein